MILVVLSALASTQATGAEHQDPRIPTAFRQVLALADQSAIILGEGSTVLLHITPDGTIARVRHPAAGRLFHVASRGPELWAVGERGLLHRRGDGAWTVTSLAEPDLDVDRPPVVMPIGEGDALVFVTLRGAEVGTRVLRARAPGPATRLSWFPDVTLRRATTDGSGTVWALIVAIAHHTGNDRERGYLRFRDDQWTAWTPDASSLRFDVGARPREAATELDLLVTDHRGGAHAITADSGRPRAFHIDSDGTLVEHPPFAQDADASPRGFVADEAGLIAVAVSSLDADPIEITRISSADRATEARRELVSLPAWYVAADRRDRAPLWALSTSTAAGVLWIAAGPLLLSGAEGRWTTYVSPAVLEAQRASARQRWTGPLLTFGPAALTLVAGVGAGAYGSSQIHDDRAWRTGVETVGGAAVGLLPWLGVTELAPPAGGYDQTPGGIITGFAHVMSIGALPTFTGAGTWAAGELAGGSQHRGLAFLGAWGGAAAGTLIAVPLSRLVRDASPGVRLAVNTLGLLVVASGATLGYQLAGGGPDR